MASLPTKDHICEVESLSKNSFPATDFSGQDEIFANRCISESPNHNSSEYDFESALLDPRTEQTILFPDFRDLGIAENYFTEICEISNESSIEDIENEIQKSKDVILNCEESSNRRRELVQQLIQLRLSLERAKEEKEVSIEGVQLRQGHQLTPLISRNRSPSKQFCDKCCYVIWSVLHIAYRCGYCDYKCHGNCVKKTHCKCPSLLFAEKPHYTYDICPEVGLQAQDYRCFQCRSLITNKTIWGEPRLCDYSGHYFCSTCHWNFKMTIPARVIHNWDFTKYVVSQQVKRFLTYVRSKPLIFIEAVNPQLFKFVNELYVVKKLRQDLIMMKDYLRTCRMAQELRLLRRLETRQHFVDNSHLYSLQDLIDINEGSLLPFLREVHELFLTHIKNICEVCCGKAFICELCSSTHLIFPFDDEVSVCRICQASFHEQCFSLASACPKCLRQSTRRLKLKEN